MTAPHETHVLTISCADTVGIVAAVSGFLAGRGLFITESAHYGDEETGRFFMRTVFRLGEGQGPDRRSEGPPSAPSPSVSAWIGRSAISPRRPRVLILVSKFDHCLNDLLYRYRTGTLPIEIPAVVSNHPDLQRVGRMARHPLSTHPARHQGDQGRPRGQASWEMVDRLSIDLVVLAPLHAGTLAGRCARRWRGGPSTSTIPSCRASRAPSPIIRPTSAA